jgi:hypothetical protein
MKQENIKLYLQTKIAVKWIDNPHRSHACPLKLGFSIDLDFVMMTKTLRFGCYKKYKIFSTWLHIQA